MPLICTKHVDWIVLLKTGKFWGTYYLWRTKKKLSLWFRKAFEKNELGKAWSYLKVTDNVSMVLKIVEGFWKLIYSRISYPWEISSPTAFIDIPNICPMTLAQIHMRKIPLPRMVFKIDHVEIAFLYINQCISTILHFSPFFFFVYISGSHGTC